MAAAQQVIESPQEKQPVLELALLHGFCVLMGLLSLAILVWFVLIYRDISVGTLTMILIDLSLGGVFMALFAWAVYTGEVKQSLDALLKKPAKGEQAPAGPAAPSA
jgi:ABC-type enterobactin transport system permease subunit